MKFWKIAGVILDFLGLGFAVFEMVHESKAEKEREENLAKKVAEEVAKREDEIARKTAEEIAKKMDIPVMDIDSFVAELEKNKAEA